MLTRQDIIDLIPRIAWAIHILLILIMIKILKEKLIIKTTSSFLIVLSIIMIILGGYLLLFTGFLVLKYRKKFSPTKIFTDGPYKHIRHPMYVGIYILLFGIGLLFNLKSIFFVSIPWMPIWYLLSRLEEKEMTKRFGEKYTKYKEKTKMFIPKLF